MSEEVAVNNIGSGAIEKYEQPLGIVSRIKRGKRLRDIIGNGTEDKKIKKEPKP